MVCVSVGGVHGVVCVCHFLLVVFVVLDGVMGATVVSTVAPITPSETTLLTFSKNPLRSH